MTTKDISNFSFEQAMSELEDVVSKLENGQVPLEDSIKLYELGNALKKHCEQKLKDAEEKVAQITFSSDGSVSGSKPVEKL
ncbi:MAG: exodeoxyribonuclease VII small subunit [Paracoccaceae bacterium]|jgi:exodeoxyribonuclease VII small subunit|nr:exodeoxyribonuclease VII small subunit [Paracoccaceae bacterium]MBL6854983.1 exodeoxyribonuclease VII small subunit [Paracoccaceae bacterium]MBV03460.1 exodeoxyribonuclease VII small subunit [Paracoccaceae bacterium]MDG1879883.1 exodeoxyribonuclease VII small subunit [Paracoccaceae bacterium]MDG1939410.1 exodeoxyribonuclease VII small subunit [Paracoccaceae bacterium]|tara:strand:- start:8967 stop:9209 length:243 start_codon:yes stop_codon:yes gene_type:complete